jgi:hypothetical protein
MRLRYSFLPVILLSLLPACGDDDGGSGNNNVNHTPIPLDPTDYTYTLEQSTAALPLWTTPATRKLQANERPPEARRSGLFLSAARHEFEPTQLVLGPGSGTVTVTLDPFPQLGSDQRLTVAVAGYEEGWAEHLTPVAAGGTVAMTAGAGTPLWITVRVPDAAPPGEHATTLRLTPAGGAEVTVPITLYVFDFDLPAEIHFASQLNVGVGGLVPDGGTVDDAKDLLFEHRMTPDGVTWPSGFTYNITWDSDANPQRCAAFYDEPDEGDAYAIRWLAPRYVLGEGWNGVGFPVAKTFQFVDNATPRPGTFCGEPRGDHLGTAAYNAAWSEYLSALDAYLVDHGLADKMYYYVQNEPQDEADHQLAAHLCRLTRAAAPHLRIAVSDEPKPEIAEDAGGACGYDIWIAHVRAYEQGYAWQRQQQHGEEVWLYSLDHDPDPYFNPTRVDVSGIHQRIIPWVSYSVRATGWAYYDAGRFFHGSQPTIRAELLREGFEDYEYLWLANGGAHPQAGQDNPVDVTVRSVASGLTSFTRDADALMALRHELGRYLEGSRDTLPVLEAGSDLRPRGPYAINFQDPDGSPTADPLVIDGRTFLKVGWQPYDADAGLGWYGEFITDPGIALYGYDDVSGYDEAQKSYVYDDYGRDNLFELALESGRYSVTIGVGRPAHGYPGDPHHATIEGIKVVDDEPTTDAAPTIERSVTVDLTDGSLSVVVGGRSATTGSYSYTFLAYLIIDPID